MEKVQVKKQIEARFAHQWKIQTVPFEKGQIVESHKGVPLEN